VSRNCIIYLTFVKHIRVRVTVLYFEVCSECEQFPTGKFSKSCWKCLHIAKYVSLDICECNSIVEQNLQNASAINVKRKDGC